MAILRDLAIGYSLHEAGKLDWRRYTAYVTYGG